MASKEPTKDTEKKALSRALEIEHIQIQTAIVRGMEKQFEEDLRAAVSIHYFYLQIPHYRSHIFLPLSKITQQYNMLLLFQGFTTTAMGPVQAALVISNCEQRNNKVYKLSDFEDGTFATDLSPEDFNLASFVSFILT